MLHYEDSGGVVFEGFGIFVEDYRSKPLSKLQLPHWTVICELGHSTETFKALFKMAEDQEL